MYQDVAAAIEWLTRVFGFTEHYRYGEPLSGAQMHAGKACLMIKGARGNTTPAQLGFGTQSLTIFLDDVDAHYAKSNQQEPKLSKSFMRPFMANVSME